MCLQKDEGIKFLKFKVIYSDDLIALPTQLWAKGGRGYHKFSDYSVHKEECFDKFHIFLKFSKIKSKIDKRNIFDR
jgi:hypothetical protein